MFNKKTYQHNYRRGMMRHCKCGKLICNRSRNCKTCWGYLRAKANSSKNTKYNLVLSKIYLKEKYITQKYSMCKIAKKIKCDPTTVKHYLDRYNIKIRNIKEYFEGKNSNFFKDGRCSKKYYCIEKGCGREISYPTWWCGGQRCQSHTMKKRFKNPNNHPMFGKTGMLSPGYGKKYKHLKHIKYNHSVMRSGYEVKYAKYLRKNHITWRYEPNYFPLVYEIGFGKIKETTYTPDFYLPETDEYIEIKGWWRDDAEEKFANFQQQYPNIKITVLMKPELQKLGVLK